MCSNYADHSGSIVNMIDHAIVPAIFTLERKRKVTHVSRYNVNVSSLALSRLSMMQHKILLLHLIFTLKNHSSNMRGQLFPTNCCEIVVSHLRTRKIKTMEIQGVPSQYKTPRV